MKAHDILSYLGRKDREGFNSAILLEFLREHHEVKVVTPPQSVWLLRCKALEDKKHFGIPIEEVVKEARKKTEEK